VFVERLRLANIPTALFRYLNGVHPSYTEDDGSTLTKTYPTLVSFNYDSLIGDADLWADQLATWIRFQLLHALTIPQDVTGQVRVLVLIPSFEFVGGHRAGSTPSGCESSDLPQLDRMKLFDEGQRHGARACNCATGCNSSIKLTVTGPVPLSPVCACAGFPWPRSSSALAA
jgi:hypothetical protein